MRPPTTAKETVSAEYRKIERRLEMAKNRQKQREDAGQEIQRLESGHQNAALNETAQESDHMERNHINVDSGQENHHTDIMTLIYERAQERYRTLEINDVAFRTAKMHEILSGRNELIEFDERLYRKLVSRIVVYKNNTAEVVFLNGCSIKIEYQSDNS